MKTNSIFGFFLLVLSMMGFVACSDVENPTIDTGLRKGSATKIEVFKDSVPVSDLSFSLGKNNVVLGVDADGEWTAELADTSWCKLLVHAGYGYTNKYTYTKLEVSKNEGDARTNTLTFRSGNVTKTIAIAQKGTGTDPNDPFMSAFTLVERFGIGYNLGNTLESNHDITNPSVLSWFNPQTVYDWETCWGSPLPRQRSSIPLPSAGSTSSVCP